MIVRICLLLLLTLSANGQVTEDNISDLVTAKDKMLGYMKAFTAIMEESLGDDLSSADALSQIAGEWVIHFTYNVTILRVYRSIQEAPNDGLAAEIVQEQLDKVIAALSSSLQNIEVMVLYTNKSNIILHAGNMKRDLQTIRRKLRNLQRDL